MRLRPPLRHALRATDGLAPCSFASRGISWHREHSIGLLRVRAGSQRGLLELLDDGQLGWRGRRPPCRRGSWTTRSCRGRVWCVPELSQRFAGAGEKPFPVRSRTSGCSGLVSDDVSCFPSTLPIVGNVSSP